VDHYTSLQEKIGTSIYKKRQSKDNVEEEEEENIGKTLYRINVNGEPMYFFREDFKTLSEIDEIIINNFINRDIKEKLKKLRK